MKRLAVLLFVFFIIVGCGSTAISPTITATLAPIPITPTVIIPTETIVPTNTIVPTDTITPTITSPKEIYKTSDGETGGKYSIVKDWEQTEYIVGTEMPRGEWQLSMDSSENCVGITFNADEETIHTAYGQKTILNVDDSAVWVQLVLSPIDGTCTWTFLGE
jgi:hypothetical protein